ncbi:teichoic acids export ABC transporter ATP-binding subunit TagH [Oceanobacillus picturae]|uniref:teichoic acids export ABC transporter ATP-binding subunit TagH n=1 Tax=Oceanobacillus picturae TaxID=171693 RepID=UPI00362EB9B3
MDKAIVTNNISKKYKLYKGSKERLLDLFSPKSIGEEFYALKDVSFTANKGDVVGFVGINGSGKSTLSNIIAGIVPASSGEIVLQGQASLIAVASGLKGDLSGRDNIKLKLLMLGFNKKEINKMEPEIVEFSELEKFIDQPVKSYSSGMKSRLGFAISVNIDPDILIIDEALSVGDKAFAGKSFDKMMEYKEKGKTMIFVSHSIGQMRKVCEKILWLEFGRVKEYGPVEEVLAHYEEFLTEWEKMSKKSREEYKKIAIEGGNPKLKKESHVESKKKLERSYYKQQLVSFLGHINGGESYIYPSPFDENNKHSSESLKNSVYYIKKQVEIEEDTLFLLGESPSAEKNIIGWMKKSDLTIHQHLYINEDQKTFIINGEGQAFNKPWGGKNDVVIGDLKKYNGEKFKVNRTEKVGQNIWVRGNLNNRDIWVPESKLLDKG